MFREKKEDKKREDKAHMLRQNTMLTKDFDQKKERKRRATKLWGVTSNTLKNLAETSGGQKKLQNLSKPHSVHSEEDNEIHYIDHPYVN